MDIKSQYTNISYTGLILLSIYDIEYNYLFLFVLL